MRISSQQNALLVAVALLQSELKSINETLRELQLRRTRIEYLLRATQEYKPEHRLEKQPTIVRILSLRMLWPFHRDTK